MHDVPLAPKIILLLIAVVGLAALGMQPVQTITEPSNSYTPSAAAYANLSPEDQARVAELQSQIDALLNQIQTLSQSHSTPTPQLDATIGDQPPITTMNGSMVSAESYLVAPGAIIRFTGKGFAADEKVTVTVAGAVVDNFTADQSGGFSATEIAPTIPNSPLYWFTGESSHDHDSVMITVANAHDSND
jgi:hypothetical protein